MALVKRLPRRLYYASRNIGILLRKKKYLSTMAATATILFAAQMLIIVALYWHYADYRQLNMGVYYPGELVMIADQVVLYDSVPFIYVAAARQYGTMTLLRILPSHLLLYVSVSVLTGIYVSIIMFRSRARACPLRRAEIVHGSMSSGFGNVMSTLASAITVAGCCGLPPMVPLIAGLTSYFFWGVSLNTLLVIVSIVLMAIGIYWLGGQLRFDVNTEGIKQGVLKHIR